MFGDGVRRSCGLQLGVVSANVSETGVEDILLYYRMARASWRVEILEVMQNMTLLEEMGKELTPPPIDATEQILIMTPLLGAGGGNCSPFRLKAGRAFGAGFGSFWSITGMHARVVKNEPLRLIESTFSHCDVGHVPADSMGSQHHPVVVDRRAT